MKYELERVALAATTEIVGAILVGQFPYNEVQKLRTDPKAYLFSEMKLLIGEALDVSFVENDSDLVALILPYYSCLDSINWKKVSDNLRQPPARPNANEGLTYVPRGQVPQGYNLRLTVARKPEKSAKTR